MLPAAGAARKASAARPPAREILSLALAGGLPRRELAARDNPNAHQVNFPCAPTLPYARRLRVALQSDYAHETKFPVIRLNRTCVSTDQPLHGKPRPAAIWGRVTRRKRLPKYA